MRGIGRTVLLYGRAHCHKVITYGDMCPVNDEMRQPLIRERFYRRELWSVRAAREFARAAAVDWGVGESVDDLLLCVSELCTNALVHGVPPGRGFRLRLSWWDGRGFRVEVHDSGGGWPCARMPDGESGRGLLLVAALADTWGVGERDPGKVVWCEFWRRVTR